jgi:large subunit ribosomal protein L25
MSTHAVIAAKARKRTGKGSARATRREGRIPAIIYSNFSGPTPISVDPSELRKTVLGSDLRFNTVLTLDVEGEAKKTALLKDWQIDPVSRRLLHADFLEIRLDEKLEAEVPLHLVGKCVGVTNGGILNQIRREVTVRCLPSDIPAILEVDISHLDVNDSLHVGDIVPPERVEVVYHTNYTLAVVTPPEREATTEETLEGALAAATAGAAPEATPTGGEDEAAGETKGEGGE